MEEQCGSLNSKGCQDVLFALKIALQTRREHGLSTHVLFVDLVKAFDTVNHSFLLLVLKTYGMPVELVSIIDRICQDFELTFSAGDVDVIIPYTIGVHQGGNLAHILFNLFFRLLLNHSQLPGKMSTQLLLPNSDGSPKIKTD